MKRIVSVSLGSAKRNHTASAQILGEEVVVERIGTGGSIQEAIKLIRELDGKVDAFGMGGIDLYVYAGQRRYTFRDAKRIAAAAVKSPIADGSGLKNTLERRVVRYIDQSVLPLKGKKVLMVASVDRFGMAEAMADCGADMVFGDMMFGLGIRWPLRSLAALHRLASLLLPVVTQLPFTWIYPTGEKQEKRVPRWGEFYRWADIIAGDYLYISRHAPESLEGKVIITNTVTQADVDDLEQRGVSMLITTTPDLGGRSFGTNLMEALIIAEAGKQPSQMRPSDYEDWLDKIGFAPRVERFGSHGSGVR